MKTRNKSMFIALMLFSAWCIGCTRTAQEYPQVGTVVKDTINGVPCCVYLPDAYAERVAKQSELVFPVLYLQHGMEGTERDWTMKGHLVQLMDTMLHHGEVKEMVIIMPDNCLDLNDYDEELAKATSGEWENNFAHFMEESEQRYRISTQPSQRAIAGLSIGGYHTMKVATLLDGQFAYVGMFSPATLVNEAPKTADVLWIGIGKDDFLYDMVKEYRQWLDTNQIQYTYYESAGGHDWPNWQDYFCRFLPLCFVNK